MSTVFGPEHVILVLMAYAQLSQINAAADVNSKARDPNVGMRFHLMRAVPKSHALALKFMEFMSDKTLCKLTGSVDRREQVNDSLYK